MLEGKLISNLFPARKLLDSGSVVLALGVADRADQPPIQLSPPFRGPQWPPPTSRAPAYPVPAASVQGTSFCALSSILFQGTIYFRFGTESTSNSSVRSSKVPQARFRYQQRVSALASITYPLSLKSSGNGKGRCRHYLRDVHSVIVYLKRLLLQRSHCSDSVLTKHAMDASNVNIYSDYVSNAVLVSC